MTPLHFVAARHPLAHRRDLVTVGELAQARAAVALVRRVVPGVRVVVGDVWCGRVVGEA